MTTSHLLPHVVQSRRTLCRAIAAALLAAPVTGSLAACAIGAGDDKTTTADRGSTSDANPLGAPPDKPLEIVIFKGGYSDEYAKFDEELFRQRFPKVKINHQGIQKVGDVLRPRFVAGDPPDVIDNTGAGRLDIASLIADGQLRDLKEVLDSPSIDDKSKTVRDTLLPGVVAKGSTDGTCYQLNIAYTVYGLWYSKPLFEKNGWTYPKSWDEMLTLCAEIKKSGISPWTYQGKYPEYMNDPLFSMAMKAGGTDLMAKLDNLEPNAWRDPAMVAAVEAIYQLVDRGFFLPGSEALSHTEAQNAWCQGKAAFIPCGSWLESEQKAVTPAGFDMVVAPMPALSSSDKLPGTAIQGAASESFIVPTKAKNPYGAMEFLRTLVSRPAAKKFAELAATLPSTAGGTEGVQMTSGLASVAAMVAAAGSDVVSLNFGEWYPTMGTAVSNATGELLTKRIKPGDWINRMQKAADDVAKDSTITKHKR
ncbi:N-acetylglucosamine/diacetylchitobiose ABC transporter substrate-binding protein [Micromonospora sp. NPDC007230]|uniref:N-acetylglucosamine/diacetylchitobiose ABC transporter substrate-binding protein n=1 Tax=Micromonospora sp. NPDC007230 TaxID=3364237 RepID=UPI0036B2B0E5